MAGGQQVDTKIYSMNDFFCGCGGIGLGFKQAGFRIAGAWDSNKYAVQTYKENVWAGVKQADIREMDIDDIPKAVEWALHDWSSVQDMKHALLAVNRDLKQQTGAGFSLKL